MAVTAILDILLGVRSGPFEKGIDTAAHKVEGFTKTVQGLGSGGISALAGFAGGALVGGVVEATKAVFELGKSFVELPMHQLEAMDTSAKLADRLGITSEELGALRVAGTLAGGGLEAMIGPMEKMGVLIASAADGNDKAIETFNSLGLSFQELHKMGRVEALREVGEALNKIGNEFDRDRAAKSIFGKSFGEAKLAIKELGENFAANKEMALKFGLTFTPQEAELIKGAKDDVEKMGLAWEGIKNTLTMGLAPAIQDAANETTSWLYLLKLGYDKINEKRDKEDRSALPALAGTTGLLADQARGDKGWIASAFSLMNRASGLGGLLEGASGLKDWAIGKMKPDWEGSGGDFGDDKAADFFSNASRDLPKSAEEGSAAAFEIIAAARQANPVVEKLDEMQITMQEQRDLQQLFLEVAQASMELASGDNLAG